MDTYDVVIVGSGFGASVLASRLGQHLAAVNGGSPSVLVLEKGRDPTGVFDLESDGGELNAQGNRNQHTLDPEYLSGVAELFVDATGRFKPGVPSMKVAAGTGLGGGSNAYLGVSLRAPAEVFDQVEGSRRRWPEMYTRGALDPYYAIVEQELNVAQMQWTDRGAPHWQLATKRDHVFAEGCRRIGATALPLKLATYKDANEGWWAQGQRFSGRQSLTQNYLLDALSAGVEFRTGHRVDTIVPDGDRYAVLGVDTRNDGEARFEVSAKILIVAAGCVGSTGLLLRSQTEFTGDRVLDVGAAVAAKPVLGRHLSGNGDYGVTGIVGADQAMPVEGHKGKPMASMCPSFWRQHQFVIIPFYAAPLYMAQGQFSTLSPAHDPNATGRASTTLASGDDGRPVRDWGQGYKDLLKSFSERVLTMGCLALDACEGEIELGPGGSSVEVIWRQTSEATEDRWNAATDTMRSIYEALGGEMYLDAYRKDGTVHTAHPLGGARMADLAQETEGMVDPYGESFTNDNLFVVDGAILPSALGVNPSLTIAAVAEMIADRLITGVGTKSLAERLG